MRLTFQSRGGCPAQSSFSETRVQLESCGSSASRMPSGGTIANSEMVALRSPSASVTGSGIPGWAPAATYSSRTTGVMSRWERFTGESPDAVPVRRPETICGYNRLNSGSRGVFVDALALRREPVHLQLASASFHAQGAVLRLLTHGAAVILEQPADAAVFDPEDLRREHRRVLHVVEADRRHRHARRCFEGGEQGGELL